MIRQGNNYKGKEFKAKLVFLGFELIGGEVGQCGKARSTQLIDKSQYYCIFSFSSPNCRMIIELLTLFS